MLYLPDLARLWLRSLTFEPSCGQYVGFFEPVFRATGFSLGWQGIIPANAAKIAEKAVTIMTQQLVTVDEVFCRLDSKVLARTMREPLRNALERVVEQVAIAHCHDVWESLPLLARAELVDKAVDVSEPYISDIVDTLRERVHDVLDLHALATEKLLEDKALMNEVFKRCGEEEFKFIERACTRLDASKAPQPIDFSGSHLSLAQAPASTLASCWG